MQTGIYDYHDFNQVDDNPQKPVKAIVPSTPFLHKYKTELCKNWEIDGNCAFGDCVSFPVNIHI
jgi:hypothetical protein